METRTWGWARIVVFFVSGALVLDAGAVRTDGARSEPRPARATIPDSNPFSAHALPASERSSFGGVVEERIAAGPYVYQRIDGRWVASLALTTPPGLGPVRVTALGRSEHFVSARLSRTFDSLEFGIVRRGE